METTILKSVLGVGFSSCNLLLETVREHNKELVQLKSLQYRALTALHVGITNTLFSMIKGKNGHLDRFIGLYLYGTGDKPLPLNFELIPEIVRKTVSVLPEKIECIPWHGLIKYEQFELISVAATSSNLEYMFKQIRECSENILEFSVSGKHSQGYLIDAQLNFPQVNE